MLMLSARAGEEARVSGLVAGADDYIIKPFSARELRARVASLLNLARARREAELLRADAEDANRTKDEFLAMLGPAEAGPCQGCNWRIGRTSIAPTRAGGICEASCTASSRSLASIR